MHPSAGGIVGKAGNWTSAAAAVVLCLACAAARAAATPDRAAAAADAPAKPSAPAADAALEADLLQVQGKWEREMPANSGIPYRRALKDVKGSEEVLTYYRADGSVWRAHRAQFRLSRSGDVKIFTFSNVQITDGDGKGTRFPGPSSYIYVATDRQFKEVAGFLPGQESQAPSVLVWKRAKEGPAMVAALPAPDARLQGSWEPIHSEEGGVDQQDPRDYLVKFEGDRFTILREGQVMIAGKFTTYSAREPRRIDMALEVDADNPKNAGKTLLGIYAIEGEELRWCTGTTVASQPPTEFVTREGEPYMMIVMRRVKAK
jgi:uncharacterized protein (TIGR03067 family)